MTVNDQDPLTLLNRTLSTSFNKLGYDDFSVNFSNSLTNTINILNENFPEEYTFSNTNGHNTLTIPYYFSNAELLRVFGEFLGLLPQFNEVDSLMNGINDDSHLDMYNIKKLYPIPQPQDN